MLGFRVSHRLVPTMVAPASDGLEGEEEGIEFSEPRKSYSLVSGSIECWLC